MKSGAGTGELNSNEISNNEISSDEEEDNSFMKREKEYENKTRNTINEAKEIKQINTENSNEESIEKIKLNILIYFFIITSLCQCLDGYILIFLGYNNSILSKEWKSKENNMVSLDIVFHLVTASGGVLSIFTTNISTRNGLNYGILMSILAFCFSLFLLDIKFYIFYVLILFVICLANGHLANICTTMIAKKFPPKFRAAVYVFAYFFTQFGKFTFACLIYKFNEKIMNGDIVVTVYPIIILIILQIAANWILLKYIKIKKNLKTSSKSDRENINGFKISLSNLIEISLPENIQTHNNEHNDHNIARNILPTVYEPIVELLFHYKTHTLKLMFLNISLGIQFFSMINVFPLLKNKSSSVILVEEILYSKAYHTVFLLLLPTIFLFQAMKRKFLLTLTFGASLIFNSLILIEVFNSSMLLHFFRFIWNFCFITTNLYCAESVAKKLRGVNTAIMYMIFKISCVIEILTIEKMISISIYFPILLNIFLLFADILLVDKFTVETHMKSIDEIENEIKSLHSR